MLHFFSFQCFISISNNKCSFTWTTFILKQYFYFKIVRLGLDIAISKDSTLWFKVWTNMVADNSLPDIATNSTEQPLFFETRHTHTLTHEAHWLSHCHLRWELRKHLRQERHLVANKQTWSTYSSLEHFNTVSFIYTCMAWNSLTLLATAKGGLNLQMLTLCIFQWESNSIANITITISFTPILNLYFKIL